MKTTLPSHTPGFRLGLLTSVVLAGGVLAGPGPQYWQPSGKSETATAPGSKPAATATRLCAGAHLIPVTTMKPSWPNGRGPLAAVQIGTKSVCQMCPVMTVVTNNAWPNGRGPVTRTEVVQPGATHDCSAGCILPK